MTKRILRIGCILLLCCMMFPVEGFAAEEESLLIEEAWEKPACSLRCEVEELPAAEVSEQTSVYLLSSSKTMEETLYDGCYVMAEIIDISQYNITPNEFERKYHSFCMMNPELLLDTAWSWRIIDGTVRQIKPYYLFPQEEMALRRQNLKKAISSYAARVSEMYQDPLEQILYLHDSLAANCAYDSEAAEKSETGEMTAEEALAFHSYGLYFNKKAVCQGYAQAFYSICLELGYEVSFCRNDGHIWNYIKMDGEWYQIDVTWDDPTPDQENTAIHQYFLCSDEVMSDHAPSQWWTPLESIPACNSTKYESGYLFNFPARKSIVKKDGYYRFIYGGREFVSDQLWTGKVLVTEPKNGVVYYLYMEETTEPMTLYLAYKDAEGILRGGEASLRSGEVMERQQGGRILYNYILPQKPGNTATSTLYIRDEATQTPCGSTLQF